MKNIKQWSADDRPREKFIAKGPSSISHSELIAILLGTGTPQKSATELAKELLGNAENNLNLLSKKTIEELQQYPGIGAAKAVLIAAAFELGRRREAAESEKTVIHNSTDIAKHFQALLKDRHSEAFLVAFLNRANRLIRTEYISEGGMTGTVADPRIILKKALDLRAVNMVLCHNHPSGNLKPSRADEDITCKIKNAAALMDIQVLDHIIVSQQGYYSFADEGLI
jgi:DNA repair protein RadC